MPKTVFSMPTPMKITGRSSSITNAFANAIIPVIEPNEREISAALDLLGMTIETICCAYCGDKYSEWDHLRPLIKDKRPTGYVSEIDNLVPSCGKCNQSKGNKDWRVWMLGPARLSPASRQIHDLQQRVERLAAYEENGKVTKIDFEAILGVELWNEHWDNWSRVLEVMTVSQTLANNLKHRLAETVQARK